MLNPFLPTVPTFAVRETDVSRHNGGTSGAPLKPLRDDSALRALSSLKGLREAPEVTPIMPRDVSLSDSKCCENATVGINGLNMYSFEAQLRAFLKPEYPSAYPHLGQSQSK